MFENNDNFNIQNTRLDPNFITGLTESEGSFSIFVSKDNRAKFNRNVGLRFKITMLENELVLLNMVESFFDGGILLHDKSGALNFVIRDFSSIKIKVIPHFIKYPLRGTKYLDLLSFKEAFDLVESKEHLTKEGLNKLYNLSKSMNSYREFPLESYYSP